MEYVHQIVTTELITFTAGLWALVIVMMLMSLLGENKYGED